MADPLLRVVWFTWALLSLGGSPSSAHQPSTQAALRKVRCSNFTGQWLSVNSEYINIVQTNCTITATNPVESWSPTTGIVEGNFLHMFNIIGTLIGSSIYWNDNIHTRWTRVTAPALDEGLANLRSMLQTAVETEQSVIQPYLSALYSIHDGTNVNASSVLHGVAVEEMLHMTTAANILNAVGGHPALNTMSFVPVYPFALPFINISVSLAPFTRKQVSVLRQIEEATWGPDNRYVIHTVGVWYFEISLHIELLVKTYGEAAVFSGDPALQVTASSSMGDVHAVHNSSDALRLISAILTEGEGLKHSLYDTSPFTGKDELSHYSRFNEIVHDRCYRPADNTSKGMDRPTGERLGNDWSAVYNFKPNPKAADYAAYPEIQQKMLAFNSCYTHLLAGLHSVFNGHPELFMPQVQRMMVLGVLAKDLMATPDPRHWGMMASPSWEWVNLSANDAPSCPILEMLSSDGPELIV